MLDYQAGQFGTVHAAVVRIQEQCGLAAMLPAEDKDKDDDECVHMATATNRIMFLVT